MLWWSAGYSTARALVLLGLAALLGFVACGGASKHDPDASTAGRAGGTSGGAGQHAGGTSAGTGSGGQGTSGAKSSGGAGGARAGAGQGAQAGADNAGGGGGGSGGQGGSAQAGTGAFGALTPGVEAYCAATVSCCASPPSSLADCEASYAEHSTNLKALAKGFQAVDPKALARCQAAYGGSSQCKTNVVWPACRDVLVGTRAIGQSCYQGADCERSSGEVTCLILNGSDPDALGVCTPAPHAKLGEACVSTCATGDKCASTTYGVGKTYALCFEDDGLYCSYAAPDPVCTAIVPLGGGCSGTGQECGSGAYCETTCQALSKLGEPCGRACRSELTCADDGKCASPSWADPMFGCKGYAPGP